MPSPSNLTRIWRLDPYTLSSQQQHLPQRITQPSEFLQSLRARHGIVLGIWDATVELAQVQALGVVKSVNALGAGIEWHPIDLQFRPTPTGRTHWFKSKPFFEFKEPVRTRYMLDDLFAENFPELSETEFGQFRPSYELRPSNLPIGGFVYVIRSEYGFKIGKTVNLKDRTKLFAVKLPFPISVEHYAWFEDYTAAERNFHLMFHAKRKEGEWFALDKSDLAKLKTFGERTIVAGM